MGELLHEVYSSVCKSNIYNTYIENNKYFNLCIFSDYFVEHQIQMPYYISNSGSL